MKKKLAAILAALLLAVSLLPAQAFAATDPDPIDPPTVTDAGEPGGPEDPDGLCRTAGKPPYQEEDPGRADRDH